MKTVFWLGIMFIMQISRLRFKQSRISAAARPRYLCFGLFRKFFGDFKVYLEINSFFSERISKIYGDRKF